MKNNELKATLSELAEQAAPSAQIDLWKKMRPHLVTSESIRTLGDAPMRTRTTLIVLAVLLGIVMLFATPQGQAFAKNLLQFFTRTPGDTIPAPTQSMQWINPKTPRPQLTPLPSPTGYAFATDCGNPPVFKCSIEQVRSKVNFTVKELGSIPAGLYFIGANGGPQEIAIFYTGNNGGLSLLEQPWTGSREQTAWQVGASAIVETVQIGKVSGEYVKGSYIYTAGDTNEVWDATLDSQSLHWVEDGIFYQLTANGPQLDKASFIALAGNLTTQPVSASSQVMPTETPDADIYAKSYPDYTLSITEAAKQAGFTVQEPEKLPSLLFFAGAMYKEQIVSIVYVQSLPERLNGLANGLVLSQEPAPQRTDCKLCGILVGDNQLMDQDRFHMIVSPQSNLETVQIGTLTGQYVEGHWIRSDCCGWIWTKEDIKTLRWWKDGTAFELSELGSIVTQADMIKIAESIK